MSEEQRSQPAFCVKTLRAAEKEEKQAETENKERLAKLFFAQHEKPLLAKTLGGGAYGKKWADWLVCVQNGLTLPEWWRKPKPQTNSPHKTGPNQAESNQIKPAS